jgi:cobalamin biosynthetic protein CobC
MADPAASVSQPRHGGDLAFATARYGAPSGGWLDLSTGINPTPYPVAKISVEQFGRLPDAASLGRLLATARSAYGVPAGTALIAVPGTEIAICLLPFVTPAGAVAVVGPTYGSHEDAWRSAGRTVAVVRDLDEIPMETGIVVVGNPNNPDGRIFSRSWLSALARRLGDRGGLLVVDEAFADVAPEVSLLPDLAGLPAIVLRSFGKFYGLAGLRLGFVAGSMPSVEQLGAILGGWPVSAPALAIGLEALSDDGWRAATRAGLKEQSAQLRALLTRHRLAVRGGTDLFVLVEDDDATGLHRRLAGRGIWTRAFSDQPAWLRIGLPGAGVGRFDRALSDCR